MQPPVTLPVTPMLPLVRLYRYKNAGAHRQNSEIGVKRGENTGSSIASVRTTRLAILRDATLRDIPGAGHWTYHDRPDEVYRALRDFGL